MGELVNINHFDVGVHFDYLRRGLDGVTLNSKSRERLTRCDKRIAVLAQNPNNALIFFSTYVTEVEGQFFRRAPQATNDEAYQEAGERIRGYQDLMGDRFFLFEGFDKPKAERLHRLFAQRGLTYNPNQTTMTAYGEWEDQCVKTFAAHLGQELGIKAYRRYIDPTLSISFLSILAKGLDPLIPQPLPLQR